MGAYWADLPLAGQNAVVGQSPAANVPTSTMPVSQKNTMTLPLILAEVPPNLIIIAAIIAFCALVFVCFLIMLTKHYRRCPSNRALVVYGNVGPGEQGAKVIRGGAVFVWPWIQDFAYLELEPFSVEVEFKDLSTADRRTARAALNALVAIDPTPEILQQAAIHLIGLSQPEIQQLAVSILRSGLQHQLANSPSIELQINRERLRKEWTASVEPNLAKIGLKLIRADINSIDCE
jgi:flotillin